MSHWHNIAIFAFEADGMGAILRAILQALCFRFRTRASLELEIIALRHQVNVLRGRDWRPVKFSPEDRLFWAVLYQLWPKSIDFMRLVKPATLIRWHYLIFCNYWKWKHGRRVHNHTPLELRLLIRKIASENPLWTALRIQGELSHLGYSLTYKTIKKYMPSRRNHPGGGTPGWKAFLRNHIHETVGIDFAVVISATFKMLYALIMIEHGSRKIIHFEVTEHPTSIWLARQIRSAFRDSKRRPKFLLRDRDAIYRIPFRRQLDKLGIQERIIRRRSPWQNGYVESAIALLRKDCLNHIIPFNEEHLRKILGSYIHYYNHYRPHHGLNFDAPCHREPHPPSMGEVVGISEVGGLHHRYVRRSSTRIAD